MDSPPLSTTTSTSILSSIGIEIISILSLVSLCMLIVVLLISTIHPSALDSTSIRTTATLVYLESPSDSTSQKVQGALLNIAAFVALITLVFFLFVLLYNYNFTFFLKHYLRFSAFYVFASMGGAIFLSVMQQFSLPIDSITCLVVLFNFTAVGVLLVFAFDSRSSFGRGTWSYWKLSSLPGLRISCLSGQLGVLLIALALCDLVAVLAPNGPLNLLVQLASSRDEELPTLICEAQSIVSCEAVHASNSKLKFGTLLI
ncbi:presenilin-like protein [Cinnamomum micranthum f. kanehirae]|uniref:Presenilin n=1 Tax=Cinnamomum micranthum f. kanehirae TaxID=337451 RepID=A0A443NDI0_9MAGN|nr:presenilin-like protein [Cinnamomum micranthum f. kanehirae]